MELQHFAPLDLIILSYRVRLIYTCMYTSTETISCRLRTSVLLCWPLPMGPRQHNRCLLRPKPPTVLSAAGPLEMLPAASPVQCSLSRRQCASTAALQWRLCHGVKQDDMLDAIPPIFVLIRLYTRTRRKLPPPPPYPQTIRSCWL